MKFDYILSQIQLCSYKLGNWIMDFRKKHTLKTNKHTDKVCSLIQQTDELRKLILENPELPIAVLVSQDVYCDYFGWLFCGSISFGIEEILDYDFYDYNDAVFTDRYRLEEHIEDILYDEYCEKSQEEYNAAIKYELEKYEPYWKKVIAIYADN